MLTALANSKYLRWVASSPRFSTRYAMNGLVVLLEAAKDGVALAGLQAIVEGLRNLRAGALRIGHLDAGDAEEVGLGQDFREGGGAEVRGRNGDAPAEPDVVIGGADPDGAEAGAARALREVRDGGRVLLREEGGACDGDEKETVHFVPFGRA